MKLGPLEKDISEMFANLPYSPGPWREVTNCGEDYETFPTLIYAGAEFVCQVATDQMCHLSRTPANAKLIAAAPEMLAALEKVVNRAIKIAGTDSTGQERVSIRTALLDELREIITRATA